MSIHVKLLGPEDAAVLENVAPDVFDHAVQAELVHEFLHDPRHHLVVALEGTQVVGMASAVHYLHPDKPPQLFINEVGVAPTHHRQGIGRQLIAALLIHGKTLGCTEAWVSTEPDNQAARGLYTATGGVEEPQQFVLFSFPLP